MKRMTSMKTGAPKKSIAEKHWRTHVLAVFVFLFSASIVGKLAMLQVFRHGEYVALAQSQHDSTSPIDSSRGEIYLSDDGQPYPLAVNRTFQMAYAVPREMKDPGGESASLSEILQLDKSTLTDKLSDPNGMFAVLKHKLSDDEVAKIKAANLPGIYLSPENFRFYPSDGLAAQVVGFVGSNGSQNRGMYGIEAQWENVLRGTDGTLTQEGDSRGRWIPVTDQQVKPAQNGADLVLTINHTVQFEVEKILSNALTQFQADSGTIVVLDPKTGKIVALANEPSFDPNNYSTTQDISTFSNPAVSQPYEPGSIFKVFTEAAGLETGKITPTTTYVDKGVVNEAGYAIRNASTDPANGYGTQTMTQVLDRSLNTGVIFIENLIGNKTFADFVSRFGFGQKTGIDLPGELAGNTHNLDNPSTTINFYTSAFGQGITTTPIQLAAAYGAIANGGMLMKPYVVDSVHYPDGQVDVTEPQQVRQVISQNTAQTASQMLRDVVVNGNGKRADVPGYLVVGKTGTAQVAKAGGGGYQDGVTIGSFVGFAPMNDPRFVVVVKMVNPKLVQWAESSAAPTSGQVMKFLLEYYKVQPTEDPKTSPLAKLPPLQLPAVSPTASGSATPPAGNSTKVITSGD